MSISAFSNVVPAEGRQTGGLMNARTIFAARISLQGIFLLTLAVQIAQIPFANAQSTPPAASQQTPLIDRQKEIAIALSSCPASLADKAGVYVLEKSGYVKVRDSQNGFTAIVQHSRPDTQEPQCMDAEGARTILPRILKIAELRAQGKTPEEIKAYVADAFAKGIFQAPARPGIDYMLSNDNTAPHDQGAIVPFPPHVMFFGTHLTNADLGSDGSFTAPAFVVGEKSPHALIIVPVATHTATDHAAAGKFSGGPQ
jgi:hypothetical protein